MKLKVGDKVRFVARNDSGVDWFTEGKEYTVKAVAGDDDPTEMGGKVLEHGFVVKCDDGDYCYCLQNGNCAHGTWELVTQ